MNIKKQKIAWHYPHLRFWMGGGSKFLLEITSEINKLNKQFKVKVITNQGRKDLLSLFKKKKVEVHTINKLACTNDFYYWLFFPFFILYEIIRTKFLTDDSDILFANLFPSNLIMAVVSKITKKPYYFCCFDPFPFFHSKTYINSHSFPQRLILKYLSFLYGWLEKWAVRSAKKVYTSNPILKEEIRKVYGVNAQIAYLVGVNTKIFKHYKNNFVSKKYKGRTIITHSTDYTDMKRTDLAIETMKVLVKKYPETILLVTSTQPNHPKRKSIQDLIDSYKLNNNVKLLGLIPSKKLPYYYASSLVYLSCAYDKSIGASSINTPVKEAMACEVPSIRYPYKNEDVEDGVTGFLIDPRNIRGVVRKIEYLIKNRKETKKMGNKARKFILRTYTWSQAAKMIVTNL